MTLNMNVDMVKAGDIILIRHPNGTTFKGLVTETIPNVNYVDVEILDDRISDCNKTVYQYCLKTEIVNILTKEEHPEYYI